MSQLSSYPNVYNTCLVILRRRGFVLNYDKEKDSWRAEKNTYKFLADNPIELLGLASIYQELNPETDKEYWWQINSPDILSELDADN